MTRVFIFLLALLQVSETKGQTGNCFPPASSQHRWAITKIVSESLTLNSCYGVYFKTNGDTTLLSKNWIKIETAIDTVFRNSNGACTITAVSQNTLKWTNFCLISSDSTNCRVFVLPWLEDSLVIIESTLFDYNLNNGDTIDIEFPLLPLHSRVKTFNVGNVGPDSSSLQGIGTKFDAEDAYFFRLIQKNPSSDLVPSKNLEYVSGIHNSWHPFPILLDSTELTRISEGKVNYGSFFASGLTPSGVLDTIYPHSPSGLLNDNNLFDAYSILCGKGQIRISSESDQLSFHVLNSLGMLIETVDVFPQESSSIELNSGIYFIIPNQPIRTKIQKCFVR